MFAEAPVQLACLVEDLVADYPGTAVTHIPEVLLKHIPILLPLVSQMQLELVSQDQKFHCVLLTYTPTSCSWACSPVEAVLAGGDIEGVITTRATKVVEGNKVILPIISFYS